MSDYEIVSDIAKAFLLESPFASDALVSYVNRHLWSPIPAELAIKMLLDAVAIKYDKEEMHPNDA